MSLINDGDFEELVPEALNLFSLPPYQSSVQKHYFVNVRPLSQINDTSPLEFHVSNSGADYIDLKRTRLHVKVKVTQADGTTSLAEDENVAPINLFMSALFSQTSVYLQNQLVSSTNNHYAYKSMMKALLGYDAEAKSTQLTSQLFYKDYARDHEFKVHLLDAYLQVCKVKVNPALILAHNSLFEKSNALYPYTKSEVKVTSIPTSQLSHSIDNVSNPVASRYIVGLVESASLNGSYDRNPYNFLSSMVKKMTLYVDGASVPGQPTEADDVATYVSMLDGMGLWAEGKGNGISRSEFLLGSALYVFDLDKICADSEYLNLVKSGDVRLELEFKSALTQPLSCIVMTQRNSLIEIDKARNVFVK
ncbi:uncharacterized protein F54H12.2-like [Haliotis asinina]|uniref:uncharacterized protein F54H12.2-like n=1 Tax=Haliotis asinina TaxID=109174 RepID=UPI0035327573